MNLSATFTTPERVVRYSIERVGSESRPRVERTLAGHTRVVGNAQDVMLVIGEIAEQGEDGLLTVVSA